MKNSPVTRFEQKGKIRKGKGKMKINKSSWSGYKEAVIERVTGNEIFGACKMNTKKLKRMNKRTCSSKISGTKRNKRVSKMELKKRGSTGNK